MIATRIDQRRAVYDPLLPYDENYLRGPGDGWVAVDPPADAQIRARFAGVALRRPFGIPAGPLLNAAYVEAAFRNGFDLNVYKTVRSVAHPVHPAPNVLSVHIPDGLHTWGAALRARADRDFAAPLSICNSFGVPSRGPDEWQPDLQRAVAAAGPGQATIASFQATPRPGASLEAFIADHAATARLVTETGTRIIELDASCPNEGSNRLLCFDADTLARACASIKDAVGDVPLGVKISAFRDPELLDAVVRATAEFVAYYAGINTLPATLVDADGAPALPGAGREIGGVCGAAIFPAALDMVARLDALRDRGGLDYRIVGIGGVDGADAARQMVACGADAVMSATAAMWNPDLAAGVAPVWDD